MHRFVLSVPAPLLAALIALASCSDSDDTGSTPEPESDASTSTDASGTGGAAGDARPSVDPFTGDCSAARWADVSGACWSCLCDACADTLNTCEEGCIDLMQCALDEFTLVGDGAEIACEVRATRATCLLDGNETTWQQAADFDVCLISSPKPDGQFRICETECGINYSGDVCERFPEPDAG
jgi:hypothetical protein